ncbi:MAG: matrixin family metalloprotease, partial [Rhodoglobus sp.]
LADPACDYRNTSIDVGYSLTFGIPEGGTSVTGYGTLPEGSAPVPTVTVYRSESGEVAVLVGDKSYGSDDAISELQSELAVRTAPGSAIVATVSQSGAPEVRTAPADRSLKVALCDNSTHLVSGHYWIAPYNYWYNSASQPSTASLTRIQAGIAAMPAGVTACGTTIAAYQGAGSYTLSVTGTPGCTAINDSHSTVGWKALASTFLAWTCTKWAGAVLQDADIAFDASGTSWYYGVSTTGCSGTLYDLQGMATHEAGHAFGLEHVAQGTGQVMRPNHPACATSDRKLGKGDAAGMAWLY